MGGYENLYIIDAIGMQIEAVIKAHKDTIWALLYLNDGTLLTSGNDNTIRQWDLINYKCLSVKNNANKTGIIAIEMLKDEVLLTSSYNVNEIRVWK
jgi:WD40 repeat protein